MSTIREMSDLKSKEVIGVDHRGRLLVEMEEGPHRVLAFKLFVTATGGLKAVPDPPDTSVDQAGGGRPERVPVSERWRGVDQT